MSHHQTEAVVLLSGGVDSSTCLAMAAVDHRCHALTLHYGQRNHLELESARRVAVTLGAAHQVLELPLDWLGGSALLGVNGPHVPLSVDGVHPSRPPASGVPVTYVPARNSIFLALGAAWAESLGTPHLFIGVNRVDYSGYPDCRPVFVEAMQRALRLGTSAADLQIHTPLIDLTKGEIIRRGSALGLDYALTWSCYDPQDGRACGLCDSCIHRKKGFTEAGVPDPTPYVS
ncbi:MAG: 7-cyano-7-deazaguanine synthase QueC [Armatimonadetes bacterium CG_4_10_14_3_um_filter_59_10]|nr:MAG: 7-cyano-7-deazaguanine synthase QueC [Armatimonadetes bacterium CG_4_10_14_3_um_filter_59_10]